MKKIGLISDTHGYFDPQLADYFSDCDEIWHAGDVGTIEVIRQLEALAPVRAVFGNIDGPDIRKACKRDTFFTCEAVDVWITHIGGYPGRYEKRVREYLADNKAPALFITGHSHILKVMMDKKRHMLHMNPGAAGYAGFHKVRTVLRFTISGKEITDLEAVELGHRSIRKDRPG
jgi:putative phosphoesterase